MNYVLLCYESPANFAARTDPLKKDTFWSAMGHYLKALEDAGYKPSEAFSLLVDCTEQSDIDRLWEALGAGGSYNVCGWLKDKFGLSWQINYAGPVRSNPPMCAAAVVISWHAPNQALA